MSTPTTTPFMDFLIGGGPLDPMRKIIDRDTRDRVGNGKKPVPSIDRLITSLYEAGRPIPDIALAVGVDVATVMSVLGVSYYCSECGMGADLSQGVSSDYCTGGDRSEGFWSTSCCGGWHLDRNGMEYGGDSPFREEAY